MTPDFQKNLQLLQGQINKRLDLFFNEKLKRLKNISPLVAEMANKIRDFTMRGGKRIRPIFVYFGYLSAGGKNKKAVLDTCIFAELLHSGLLIHDDIIDRDELRRGQLTVHRKYAKDYRSLTKEAGHLGICGGILAGDLISSFCYEILTQSNFSPELKEKAISRLNQILEDVISGQVLDIFLKVSRQLQKKDILKIYEYKTARYTIEGPLQIGAILAGADTKTLRILSQYAIPLGIAFQIKDDILGMFGDQKVTGKSISSDVKEGKQTLLILEAKRRASAKQKEIIKKTFGNSKARETEVQRLREIVKGTGALDYAMVESENLANKAKDVVQGTKLTKDAKAFLIATADYIIRRKR